MQITICPEGPGIARICIAIEPIRIKAKITNAAKDMRSLYIMDVCMTEGMTKSKTQTQSAPPIWRS